MRNRGNRPPFGGQSRGRHGKPFRPRPHDDGRRAEPVTAHSAGTRGGERGRWNRAHEGGHAAPGENYRASAAAPGAEHERGGGGAHQRDIVFGVEPVRELISAAPETILALHLMAGQERRFLAESEAVRAAGGRVITADAAALQRMAGSAARHQGIIAAVREYAYAPLEEVLAAQPDPLLIVEGVTDPRNLGAILRSAEGAGARAVVIARDRTAGITPAAIKASAGAWIHLRIARCGNVARILERLKADGYWIAALAADGDISLYDLDATRRICLVAGSEDRGVRRLVRQTADFVVNIPMRGRVASLNVAVAAAIALYEIGRRRQSRSQAPSPPSPRA